MAEHALCPRCGHENPSENRFCGSCGVSLEASSDVVARRENDLTVKGHALPARLGHISKAVAAGLAMLGAEVGLSWLRHRIRAEDRPSALSAREPDTVVSEAGIPILPVVPEPVSADSSPSPPRFRSPIYRRR